MNIVKADTVSADEVCDDLGTVDLSLALSTFDKMPWDREIRRAEETGLYPTVSFRAPDDNDSYLSITGIAGGSFFVMIEAIKQPGFLGLFRKAACIEFDGIPSETARDFITRFFTLDLDDFYDWVSSNLE